MARPRQNKEIKQHQSIRLEHSVKEEIRKKYGSIQAWIDEMVKTSIVKDPDRK